MNRQELFEQIRQQQSFLCVGLDTDLKKIPADLLQTADPQYEFNRRIIDATRQYAVAYKINTAFYEVYGAKGWESMRKTVAYLPNNAFKIADAKRGDIGNTSEMYAEAFLKQIGFDAITLSPYMGEDSISPYYQYAGKWAIILGLTSNKGSADLQLKAQGDGYFYETVLKTAQTWGNTNNTMFVIGATQPAYFERVRQLVPEHFLLVPGVGAQGGDLHAICAAGLNSHCGLLVNSSRNIIYAGKDMNDFEYKAQKAAENLQMEMAGILKSKGLI
ncbi:MAG: orotidine-5'-phosphate decarboxylase [Chitinophagales bacterium]|nr:orotidine-5'-phosphate decarboxylase [Chitinophagales bacterium]